MDRFDLLARHISHTYRASLQYLAHRSLLRAAHVPSRQFRMCGSRSTRPKRARQALRPPVQKVCRIIEMTALLHEIIETSESIMHNGFKISYNEISYMVTVGQSTVAGSTGVERIGGNGKRQGINRQHEMWIEWKGESTYRSPTFQRFYSSSESESSTSESESSPSESETSSSLLARSR